MMLLLLLLLLFLFPLSTSSHVFFLFFNFLLFFFPSSISRLRSRWLVPHPAEPLPLPIFTEEKLLELREAFERMSTRTCYRPALMWDVKGKLLSPLLFFLFLIIVHSHVLVSIQTLLPNLFLLLPLPPSSSPPLLLLFSPLLSLTLTQPPSKRPLPTMECCSSTRMHGLRAIPTLFLLPSPITVLLCATHLLLFVVIVRYVWLPLRAVALRSSSARIVVIVI